ncbi:hypothetical protein [Pyrobaculum ferrireducens]|uniref:Uncharacterized protein n=1 Tax=Pyrobaculum ferrireducens TaxID=1104324 RepID=G7VFB0_9CREN|nr:hypothetical protein [Pyrobaculum ferrireducens]AET31726.1 hypothetical protein P186_0266 [Pyrobaculum ferrireducens]
MRPIIGALSGVLQYMMFSAHPILSIYPRSVDGALGQGAFAALLIVVNLAVSTRYPYTSAFSTLTLYLAEAALSSPTLRLALPLPELPPPDTALGVAAVLLLVASSAEGIHGLYLASAAAPAAALILLKDLAPRLDYPAALALFLLGLSLVVYATKSSRG